MQYNILLIPRHRDLSDIILQIYDYLDFNAFLRLKCTSSLYYEISFDKTLYKHHLQLLLRVYNHPISICKRTIAIYYHNCLFGVSIDDFSIKKMNTSDFSTARYAILRENKPITNIFTTHNLKNLTHLMLCAQFDSSIEALRHNNTIQYLNLGYKFNQSIDPLKNNTSITTLIFGIYFNQQINALKNNTTLTRLSFDNPHSDFNQSLRPIENNTTLTTLDMGSKFNKCLNILSNNVKLTHLSLGVYFGEVPNSRYMRPLEFNEIIKDYRMYNNITHLHYNSIFTPITFLQYNTSITHLTLGNDFNNSIDDLKYNNTITHLTLGHDFNQPLDPLKDNKSITHLIFAKYSHFNKSFDCITNNNTIKYLVMPEYFNQPIDFLRNNNTIIYRDDPVNNSFICYVNNI
jgi:hypothetical protein